MRLGNRIYHCRRIAKLTPAKCQQCINQRYECLSGIPRALIWLNANSAFGVDWVSRALYPTYEYNMRK